MTRAARRVVPTARMTLPDNRSSRIQELYGEAMAVDRLPPSLVRRGILPRCYECGAPLAGGSQDKMLKRLCHHCRELPQRIAALRARGAERNLWQRVTDGMPVVRVGRSVRFDETECRMWLDGQQTPDTVVLDMLRRAE